MPDVAFQHLGSHAQNTTWQCVHVNVQRNSKTVSYVQRTITTSNKNQASEISDKELRVYL